MTDDSTDAPRDGREVRHASGNAGRATAVRAPSAVRRLADRLAGLVGLASDGESPRAEPGLAASTEIGGDHGSAAPATDAQRALPPGASVSPSVPGAGAQSSPPVGGRRGVDFEVVSTRRGLGTPGALLFLVVLGVIAWMAGSRGYRWVSEQLDPPGDPTGEIVLTLPPGSSTASISDLLGDHGVVPSSRAYEWYVRFKGGPAFQAGEYTFQSNSSVWETLAVLEAGPSRVAQAAQQSLTIPEGLTVAQMAALLDEVEGLSFSGRDFGEAIRERPVLSLVAPVPRVLPDGVIEPAEGQLFADTYFFDSQTSAEQLVALMVDRLDAVLTELGYDDAPRRVGLTPYEALIVASMIEREAQRPEDRAKVARVIYNRLARGWSLGLDATVVYVVGESELTAELLAVNSPYNTRVLVGLPPTPIATPGRASLEAALNPTDGPWMYFVLTSPDGTLSFSETDEEFQRDKAVCQELGLCG
ncbi:endolytic transglycosylase MltG [Candidatus Poriferisodalis sp.]|uniref:endolytic transglycosylase MltG n=1 Tax=Candidatus Poriferisodalis sp. TaxID=3101277 RepID=UPI003B01A7B9